MTPLSGAAALLAAGLVVASSAPAAAPRPMSVSNRLLLNRAALSGLSTIEVMVFSRVDNHDRIARRVERFGGRTLYEDRRVAYSRVQLPTDRVVQFVDGDEVDAYQISSMSRGSWYRDGPPQANAEMYRGFERIIPNVESPRAADSGLLPLSASQATAAGYTADEDAGVGRWRAAHPTFDGRGVTIALLETGQPEFASSIFGPAKSIGGGDLSKLAGIVDAIGDDEPDETRVALDTEIDARSAWNRVGDRTYALPHPGHFRFGVFSLPVATNLISQFAVLRDEQTGHLWVDANGNADFRDEAPVPDVNHRFEVRMLRVPYPKPTNVGFVVGPGRTPSTVHVYLSRSGHQTMTVSVAAGSRTKEGLAFGVAPGARVLLVRYQTADLRLRDFVEGYLEAAKRPDVDILCDSTGVVMAPDAADEFVGLLFRRLIAAYGKPIFAAAGNMWSWLATVSAAGDAFAVGGSIGPATFAALYGGASLARVMVHPVSAAGPSIDGTLKPDFIAPVHRIAADLAEHGAGAPLPKNSATAYLPLAYQISCCTSASSPYAAGVAALLVSAAKQRTLRYSFETFGRALRIGARFLPDTPAHAQGNGVLDVESAWRELNRGVNVPRIVATAPIVHPLAAYGIQADRGAGLFERDGWTAGMTGVRTIRLNRTSGPDMPITYRATWSGNDGTFRAADAIRLPRGEPVPVPITITTRSAGVHSAILNLHDPETGAITFRMLATIVASEQFDRQQTIRVAGRLPLLATRAHYVSVPPDVSAMSIELRVIRGSVRAHVLPSHGLLPSYYGHVYPQGGRTFMTGVYHVTMPNPVAGSWAVAIENTSAWAETDRTLVSIEEAEYVVKVQLLDVSVRTQSTPGGDVTVRVTNRRAPLVDPLVTASFATVAYHHDETLASGLPNLFPIEVPSGTATLALDLRADTPERGTLELHLYDCTTGECFSYNFTLPAKPRERLLVRRPEHGRWIAAVNAAPSPREGLRFQLEVTVASDLVARANPPAAESGRNEWTATLHLPRTLGESAGNTVFVQVVDQAVERGEEEHPWENRALLPKLGDRPIAIGAAIYRGR